jgi:hypothetical protein
MVEKLINWDFGGAGDIPATTWTHGGVLHTILGSEVQKRRDPDSEIAVSAEELLGILGEMMSDAESGIEF